MKKNLLISIALLSVSTLFAGNAKDIRNATVSDGTRKSEYIMPDAEGRLFLNPEIISGLQAVKERMAAPLGPTQSSLFEIEALMNRNLLEKNLLENKDMLERQKAEAAHRRAMMEESARQEPETSRAGLRRAPAISRPNQWSYPFQAIGEGIKLSGVEHSFSLNGTSFQKYGLTSYTYDEEGNVTKTQTVMTNTNGILNKMMGWSMKIPVNAIVTSVTSSTEDMTEDYTVFKDPATGKEQYLEQHKYVTYNGYQVTGIDRRADKDGNMIEYQKVESEFDDSGRPIQTIFYSRSTSYDPATDSYTVILKPYMKAEYQETDGLMTRTTLYPVTDANGTESWQYNTRITKGTNDKGEECYEYMYYDAADSVWYGSSKYTRLVTEDANGSDQTTVNWSWDYNKHEWYLSNKSHYRYNSMGRAVLYESYYFDAALNSFYLNRKNGNEYLGDTLACGSWSFYYNSPSTIEELSDPDQLIYSGSKSEWLFYTAEELGISLNDNPDLYLPRKSEANYTYDTKLRTWVGRSKYEYKYILTQLVGYDKPDFLVSCKKNYEWIMDGGVWTLYNEANYQYDDHGSCTLQEVFTADSITERRISKYKYFTDSYNYPVSHEIYNEYWSVRNNKFSPSYITETDYDDNGNQTLYSYLNNWDNANERWNYGYRYDYEYDSNSNRTLNVYSSWNPSSGTWIGGSKETAIYDDSGDIVKRESFYGESDGDGGFTWTPSTLEETKKDTEGNTVSYTSYSYWSKDNGMYQYGDKEEWSYSNGLLTGHSTYYYSDGEWHGQRKETYEYDDNERLVSYSNYNYDYDDKDWSISGKTQYTYTESGESKDIYEYSFYNGEQTLVKKKIAQISDGRITGYTDSSYYSWSNTWVPNSKMEYVTGTDGRTTITKYDWDSYAEEWRGNSKVIQSLDDKGRIIYTESYSWDSYDSIWYGNNKEEYTFNDKGERTMYASYYWNDSDTAWVGSYKYEEEYDEYGNQLLYAYYSWDDFRADWYGYNGSYERKYDSNGNMTYYAYYIWDDDLWAWKGDEKREYEYDAEGTNTMTTYYSSTDSLGNWIGSSKNGYTYKDGVSHSEGYIWDTERNDWRGDYMSEYTSSDTIYMSTSYSWDEENWCWVGSNKYERRYYDNGSLYIRYDWDTDKNDWVYNRKELTESENTATYSRDKFTSSVWNREKSQWEFDERDTYEIAYRGDENYDYELECFEVYDVLNSRWVVDYYNKYTYLYTGVNSVESIGIANLNISVSDGSIMVNADPEASISIVSATGSQIASGKGSVSASVVSGIYLITVDGKTTKIMVR